MPDSKLIGKSREDLAAIAVLSGLLLQDQAAGMTKAQLLKFLKTAESSADQPSAKPATKAAKPKKTVASAPTAQPEPVLESALDSTVKKPVSSKPARQRPIEREQASSRQPSRPATKRTSRNQPTTRSASHRQPASAKRPTQPTQGTAPKSRPVRVKMFGIPQNPLAAQSDEHEEALLLQSQQLDNSFETVNQLADAKKYDVSENDTLDLPHDDDDTLAEDLENVGEDQGEKSEQSRERAAKKAFIESGESITGVLEIMPDGYGFLRRENYIQGSKDAYVPPQYIRRFNLRPGDLITGPCKKQRDNDRYQALLYIKEVNGESPEKMLKRPHFDRLTPIYPDERYILETTRNELSTRIIDLVSPIGKGQRGMIVSPPKAGKTILLQKIANAISENNPDVKLIVLLIDERPEEVTDMQRSINGEVVYSTFDKTPENHVKITELVLERAMRLVELKQDVVILLDSMTRLGRAYNLTITPTGRTLSGGLDPGALYGPKRFFGAARNIENGGSLTIIATSLIETGSRMDEVIFEEFKGTGNMEVLLDRKLSEKRIFPAIDINKSGTRREELLLSSKELDAVWTIRKAFGQLDTAAVTETIINLLLKTTNNQQFISSVNVSFNDKNVFDAMRGNRPNGNGSNNNNN